MNFSPHFISQIATSPFLHDLRKGQIIIDNSSFSTWGSCFTMGLYSGGLRRVNAKSRSPLAYGGAVHAGLDSFFKGEDNWRDVALADAAITELDSLGDGRRNTSTLINLLESYILHYTVSREAKFDILMINGVPAVEKSFVVPLGTILLPLETADMIGCPQSIEILWSGKIDLLTMYEGAITPVDHKTTSVMGEKFIDDKIRSSQMLGYTFASRFFSETLFNNAPVFGTRINALASRSAGYEFKLFDIPYPAGKVDEWKDETIEGIAKLVSQLAAFLHTGKSLPTREHCVTKYGKCPYFDVCDSVPKMRDRMIFDDSYYFVSEWSPLNE